ncbi:MAG: L-serine ammonia-lyase, iron-sulfur-dependent subunit beta [Breznakia sp.]
MKEIGIFDVIGPNMIGPSSSHTAGALRIAYLARKIANEKVVEVTFKLYGSFSKTYQGHGSDRALLAGILGHDSDDIRIRDAFLEAKEKNVSYTFELMEDRHSYHPNTVVIEMRSISGRKVSVRGESIGGGNIVIRNIDGVEIDLSGEYHTIVIRQKDTPGIVARISECLANYNINIAFMKLYREDKGANAYTIIETDDAICKDVLKKVLEDAAIASAVYIERS